jgi:hypothetical protein
LKDKRTPTTETGPVPELISQFELDARALLETYRAQRGTDITPTDIAVLGVFRAQPEYALTVVRIARLADALAGTVEVWEAYPDRIQAALTRMVRAKVLRTRVTTHFRLYELAL